MSRTMLEILSQLWRGFQPWKTAPSIEKHSLCSVSDANFDKHQSKTRALECYRILCQEVEII